MGRSYCRKSGMYNHVFITHKKLVLAWISFRKKKIMLFLSPPVRMHGGLICIALRLDVIGPKVTCQKVISLEPFDV